MKLNLPVPSPEHVERYKDLIRRSQEIELSDAEALDQCTRLVHYVFLTEHALPALRHFREAQESSQSQKEEGSIVQAPSASPQGNQPEEWPFE